MKAYSVGKGFSDKLLSASIVGLAWRSPGFGLIDLGCKCGWRDMSSFLNGELYKCLPNIIKIRKNPNELLIKTKYFYMLPGERKVEEGTHCPAIRRLVKAMTSSPVGSDNPERKNEQGAYKKGVPILSEHLLFL
jgi:hypothetical protein